MRVGTRVNAGQTPQTIMREPTQSRRWEGRRWIGRQAAQAPIHIRRGIGAGTHAGWEMWQHGKPCRWRAHAKPVAREGRTGPSGWWKGPQYRGRRATPAGGRAWLRESMERRQGMTTDKAPSGSDRFGNSRPYCMRKEGGNPTAGFMHWSTGCGEWISPQKPGCGLPQRRIRRVGRGDIGDTGASGVERWLGELSQDLGEGTHTPKAVRQAPGPKRRPGQFRPLGIPCIRDWVLRTPTLPVSGRYLRPIRNRSNTPIDRNGARRMRWNAFIGCRHRTPGGC